MPETKPISKADQALNAATTGQFLQQGPEGPIASNDGSGLTALDPTKLTPATITATTGGVNPVLPTVRGGLTYWINGVPSTYRKKVVIVGSSVAAGTGATGGNGWAQQLGTALVARGWTVVNTSVGGNTTAAVISRFYSDVAPENPDVAVIALSLNNEGLAGAADAAAARTITNTYLDNLKQLIRMVRQQGALPIIAGPYPNDGYDATHYAFVRLAVRELDRWGVAWVDFLGAVDDGSGHWVAAADGGDGTHPNDVGHAEMFRCFPPSLLDRMTTWDYPLPTLSPGALSLGLADATLGPISYNPAEPLSSFTVFFRVRAQAGVVAGRAYLSFQGTLTRIRDPGTALLTYTASSGAEAVSTVNPTADRLWHSCAVAHDGITGESRFFVDGAYVGSVTETLAAPAIYLGGRSDPTVNAVGRDFKDFLVYRTRLLDEQVGELHAGLYLKGSLEVYAPLNDPAPAAGTFLTNLAPTAAQVLANSPNLTSIAAGLAYDIGGTIAQAQVVDLPAALAAKADATTTTAALDLKAPIASPSFTGPVSLANAQPLRARNGANTAFVTVANVRSDDAIEINPGGSITFVGSTYAGIGTGSLYVTGLNVGGQGVCVATSGSFFAATSGGAARRLLGLDGADDVTIASSTVATKVLGSLAVGGGTAITKVLSATATLDFGPTAAQTSADLTVSVTGAAVGGSVSLGLPAAPAANTSFSAWVSAADVVTVRFLNSSASPVDPASGTYRVTVANF